ncbi:MAG: DUF6345 domain-containing protein [Fimbriimonadaceae bacterium]
MNHRPFVKVAPSVGLVVLAAVAFAQTAPRPPIGTQPAPVRPPVGTQPGPIVPPIRPVPLPAPQRGPLEYRVSRHGADPRVLVALDQLGGKAEVATDGAVRFMARDRFLAVPTRKVGPGGPSEDGDAQIEAIDFGALAARKVVDRSAAIQRVTTALRQSGVDLEGATPIAFHSEVEFGRPGATRTLPIDTGVSFRYRLGNMPLIGPGAKMRFALDGEGNLTHGHIATRQLTPGNPARLLPPAELDRRARMVLGSEAKLQSQMVCYAPPMEIRAARIVPHMMYTGTISAGQERIPLRTVMIPAVQDAPTVGVSLDTAGGQVVVKAVVEGGRAPFRFSFSVPGEALVQGRSASVAFRPDDREGVVQSSIMVQVEDSDGLVGYGRATLRALHLHGVYVEVPSPKPLPIRTYGHLPVMSSLANGIIGRLDIGIHAVGMSYENVGQTNLSRTVPNADGFWNKMRSLGVTGQFRYVDGSAWETDWKANAAGGRASAYFDNVDLGFFSGHAGGGGWLLSTNRSDSFVSREDVRLGAGDAEWVVIAACGPLQPGAIDSWSNSFQGLHLLCGYGTNSFDTDREGRIFAEQIATRETFIFWTVRDFQPIRQAWINTAIECQPSHAGAVPILVGVMGVRRERDGASSWNDYWHGAGPVSPDVPAGTDRTFWVVRTGT